ncbi:Sda1p [Sporobolomyces salmoneus]|uniref:Sda1p n=1 Tax=Sporobolomyces salmoneus TaxID=183962 RepID=UPI003173065E
MPLAGVGPRPASNAGSRATTTTSRTGSTDNKTGLRTKTQRGALITSSLPTLQNLIKRSPESYAEEFGVQWNRFGSLVKIVQLGLGGTSKQDEERLKEVTGFVCQVAHLYPTLTSSLPSILSGLLLSSTPAASTSSATTNTTNDPNGAAAASGISGGGVVLAPETRKTMMQGLVLLRRRDVITGVELLKTLFPLLSLTTSPNLRSFILKTIIGDIKHANLKTKHHKLNRMVQGLCFQMIERGIEAETDRVGTGIKASRRGGAGAGRAVGAREAMWAVKIATELWRKNIWRDEMTVKLVARACFHPDTKVQSAAMHFFLVTPDQQPGGADFVDSDEEDDAGPDIQQVKHKVEINKKRKSSDRKARREIKSANQKRRQKEQNQKEPQANFSAIELLQNPEGFGEQLYAQLVGGDRAFTLEHKVLMMQLFGRVSTTHKLTVLPFYSYILKYLTHHQLQITQILVALAQSVHDRTPDEDLQPVLRKIAAEFVHSGVAAEVNAAGLNAITEISRRQPLAMDRDLLEDLIEYRKSKDKGVLVAARGLLQLFREVNPELLKRRERGKVASMAIQAGEETAQPLRFGEERDVATGIDGLDLFAKHLAEKSAAAAENGEEGAEAVEDDDEAGWDGWEAESNSSDDSDSSGGWINVESDGDSDLEISDSEDDDEDRERKRRKTELKDKEKGKKGKGKVVEMAALKEEDEIEFDDESGEDEDSDDEDEGEGEENKSTEAPEEYEMSLARANKVLEGSAFANLATTKILTPADFAKIDELRMSAAEEDAKNGGGAAARRKLAALAAARKANHGDSSDAFLVEGDILGLQKKKKNSYEERLAKIAEGREGREKFGSHKHKKLDDKAHSTTNAEKKRKKNFAMVAHSYQVTSKSKASLHQKSKKLRNHVNRTKTGGRRRNGEHK